MYRLHIILFIARPEITVCIGYTSFYLLPGPQIFLRELISNASDALDKIRFLSLLDKSALAATEELTIKIKADKDGRMLHVTDTGIGKEWRGRRRRNYTLHPSSSLQV